MAMMQLQRNETALEAMSKSIADLMSTITQLKMMKGQRVVNEAAQNAIAAGGGLPEINEAVQSAKMGSMGGAQLGASRQPEKTGIFNKIMGTFNPAKPIFTGSTDTENLITQLGIRNAAQPQTTNYGAEPYYYRNATPQQRQQLDQAAMDKQLNPAMEKPLNIIDINRGDELMTQFIDNAYKRDWGGKNYTKENLVKGWQDFKGLINYDSMPDVQKQQYAKLWNTKLQNRKKDTKGWIFGSEVDWDPEMLNQEFESSNLKSQEAGGGSIRVKAPDGTIGTIPVEDWEEASRQGYMRVQ